MGIENINQGQVTGYYNGYFNSKGTRNVSGRSMAEIMAEKEAAYTPMKEAENKGAVIGTTGNARISISETTEASKTGSVSTKDMTMDEYKQYIRDKIDSIPKGPVARMTTISITISEEGFEAMKNDPEYEKWVLDGLEENWKFDNDPWIGICGGSFETHYFGATKEEYRGQGWYSGFQFGHGTDKFVQDSQNAFWTQVSGNSEAADLAARQKWEREQLSGGNRTNNAEKKRQLKKQYDKKRLQHEQFEKEIADKKFNNNKLLSEYFDNQIFGSTNPFSSCFSSINTAAVQAMFASGFTGGKLIPR